MYRPPGADREFWLYFVGFLAAGPVPKAPEGLWDSFGPILEAWRPFLTHFGHFMILGPTPYLRLQQSELLGRDRSLLFQQRRCVLLQQDKCLLLRQDRCLLLEQDRCAMLKQDTFVLLKKNFSLET